ncbi:MAG: aspartate aminotransferase family protein [Sphingobacteriia bacterium 24-36-13]|jgi:acetylornithine/succinyldiaminopimelate/putrescine aminotransferase|uniref:aspartate aminotransferase family protein n=1 Tax=Sediminibacterium sp. TaxID=1917865 RepID=UPI000BDC05E9|nr:aspartate aminotransferase family protein [Sediminibacterium sp.]OYY09691.1 MAG: aspartate aminotransferase family protein [Sphingobacteriia bacterium 35-36-14]OYZ54621.1 MAG: aspartate aminotransferase family protein [Sphingobacteriia bacterium 24-36-13]OZA63650.1 MAG: aspartate aminotransferase family protein [Sphingobacteriia bacterium 39-36-14]HQS24973.1 aspartate aminotransferase family protein [Sediminibacterium sp.]HQS35630.1 aspartate aminotransferase family protein [Sediminibacteri
MNHRQLFLDHVAQTSPKPIGIEMASAEGVWLTDTHGKKYIDGIAGFSVCNVGHGNPAVIKAVQEQAAAYMHVIVYGEFIEQPQVAYAKLLTEYLPASLNCVYFTNSGAEATEGAMKLAKRITNRTKIIAANQSYHGSTQGALSVMGDEYFRNAFRPLLPDVYHYDYGADELIEAIDSTTACVIIETVQAESGVTAPSEKWMKALRAKCDQHCVLLILDEIQAGFGRTGTLWAFEQYGIVPDILLLGKALGGGMPLGAFIADQRLMNTLTYAPVLGHITTFGGHPVSCAAGKAAFEELIVNPHWIKDIPSKAAILKTRLQHPSIVSVNCFGLWMSVQFASPKMTEAVAHACVQNGLVTDWFLFAPDRIRIAPPLIITEEELHWLCDIVLKSIDEQ